MVVYNGALTLQIWEEGEIPQLEGDGCQDLKGGGSDRCAKRVSAWDKMGKRGIGNPQKVLYSSGISGRLTWNEAEW